MRSVRSILSVSSGYIAAVIGAGFASGQEIVSFFVRYGKYGIIGILTACIIFSLFSYAVLAVCVKYGIHTYSAYVEKCFPSAGVKKGINILTLVFAMATMCVMTACAGEMGFMLLGINRLVGAAFFSLVCGIIFFMGGRRVIRINSILGIVLIIGIVFCCMYILRFREHQVFFSHVSSTVSGASYAGYNLLTVGAILAGMSSFLQDKKEAALASIVSGTVLFLLIVLIWGILSIYYGKINLGEIPMLTMTFRQNNVLGAFYSIMLFLAVMTTSISSGFGIIDIVSKRMNEKYAVILMIITSFAFSGAGFSTLINTAYRVCGYAGIMFVSMVIYVFLKKEKKIE